MGDIVLSASVRQNLLSLQSTAELLSTTQNRLATGKKVNTALDNPTNFFTASSLDARASDINNLLDSIGNGVQVLQAANTGITSLQKLVDSAKSIANQALQATSGYSSKSKVTTAAIPGATAGNLLGTGAATNAVASATSAITPIDLTGTAATNATVTGSVDLSAGLADPGSDITFDINGQTVTLTTGSGSGTAGAFTLGDITTAINGTASVGVNATDDGNGHLVLTSTGTAGSGDALVTTGTAAAGLGIADATVNGGAATTPAALTFDVNGEQVTLASGASYDGSAIASAINSQVGTTANVSAAYTGGRLVITSTGTAGAADSVTVDNFSTGGAQQLGFAAATASASGAAATSGLSGQTLDIASTDGGAALSITFGTANGEVSTLDQLNTALAANNMSASIKDGVITFTTTNDHASATIGAFSGTATGAGNPLGAITVEVPVAEANAQNTRANLISQYNTVIDQIRTTAQDASFNGINLLNGDQLKLVFNETGKSTLNIQGVTFNPDGLGLAALTKGVDFLDNSSTNKVLDALNTASSTLRSQASAFGSNLSIVQIRQDFSKNLINVLQTGSSNLILADTNEEAANSQALSTRQSIAVSALALANQSQQSVLQLLR
ncbi:MAG TPA: flagellin [Xanthobacteraceae bacterium]|nr:flagellin [Xanthobacteraceae bacterium]